MGNLDPRCYAEEGVFLKENHNHVLLGWTLLGGVIYPSVVSLGKNPYFENMETSIEVHILHDFEQDFYDSTIRVAMLGTIRSMHNILIPDLGALKELIQTDCEFALSWLEENKETSKHKFLAGPQSEL